ncbi:hypothetical protein crov054 [Cafeteria roenbergensis virus]|uniref:Uncharacterized protein n=1 Tax=Cafeteria roenbergensis virus (strain BV-PW1) TaxID=693272 RepID=E3T4H4_CROVB|nr:hypothetical protein crov054 [Cafeteria roenbergensis virus BV-PW1]ADO67087.1 hypothetical protein crov054 [Cafeteria roenbergensis virus BV-PW1]
MDNQLKNIWKNISFSDKKHILNCLGKNKQCNNQQINHYLTRPCASAILRKLSNIVGGSDEGNLTGINTDTIMDVDYKDDKEVGVDIDNDMDNVNTNNVEILNKLEPLVKSKIKTLEEEIILLTNKTATLNIQKQELEDKFNTCNMKIKDTEKLINELTQNNNSLKKDNENILDLMNNKLQTIINIL